MLRIPLVWFLAPIIVRKLYYGFQDCLSRNFQKVKFKFGEVMGHP